MSQDDPLPEESTPAEDYSIDVVRETLRDLGGVATTADVADALGCADHIAHERLTDLEAGGQIDAKTVDDARLWILPERELEE